MKQMIRQGDVLLMPVEDCMQIKPKPVRQNRSRNGRLVIAEGESSLHEHTIDETDAELIRQGDRMLLWVERDTNISVTHSRTGEPLPRHSPLPIGPGMYEVRTQRRAEVTPAGLPQRWSRVRD